MKNRFEKMLSQLANAHNEFVKISNEKFSVIDKKIDKIAQDLGSLFDVIYANERVKKSTLPSVDGLTTFCKKSSGMDFFEMTSDTKALALIQFLESLANPPASLYNDFIVESFRKRNKLVPLRDEKPRNGDIAIISWLFTDSTGASFKNEYGAYNLGMNSILIDHELMEMKAGDTKEIDVSFPENYPIKQLCGKSGKIKVTIHSFDRVFSGQPVATTEEEKKKVWDEKYNANVIE